MPAVVVGISGSTRSGKGTLVRQLRAHLLGLHCTALTQKPVNGAHRFSSVYGEPPTVVSCITQDSFFLLDKIMARLGGTYDTPEALNHDDLLQSLMGEMGDCSVTWILLEGFMAFYDERLFNLCNIQIWLDVPMDVARKRRQTTKWVSRDYFDQIIWPNHKSYENMVFARPGAQDRIGVIDGTQPFSAILPAAVELLARLGGPAVVSALQVAACAREIGVHFPVISVKCKNPDCEYQANSDPAISAGFCCEKCEGRWNGEEWAMIGKKKHTAYCSSKQFVPNFCVPAYGPVLNRAKCAHPDCNYMRNSDPTISRLYCCEKCDGLHKGEKWAKSGKRHYKNCEKIEFIGTGACNMAKGGCKGFLAMGP